MNKRDREAQLQFSATGSNWTGPRGLCPMCPVARVLPDQQSLEALLAEMGEMLRLGCILLWATAEAAAALGSSSRPAALR